MADVGDRIELLPSKAGQVRRAGVVTAITGVLITVRWDTGEETKFVPGPGVLTVMGASRPAHQAAKAPARRRTPAAAGPAPRRGAATKKAASTTKATTSAAIGKPARAIKKSGETSAEGNQPKAKHGKAKDKGRGKDKGKKPKK